MSSRTWIKIYVDKWLEGTISEESISIRGVWVSLLALAGNGKYGDSGHIMALHRVGFTDQQLTLMLKINPKMWGIARKRLQTTGRITVNNDNVITIINWQKYQSEYERTSKYRSKDTTSDTPKGTGRDREDRLKTIEVEVGDRGNDNLLNELDKLTSWGKSQEDGLWLLEFKKEFNEFNDSHIKACRDYHSTKTKHTKALWKTRLRNWMVIEKRKVSNNGAKGKMATPDELKTGWG